MLDTAGQVADFAYKQGVGDAAAVDHLIQSYRAVRADSRRLREVIVRLNVDWPTARHECGDPKCGGDCRYVAELEALLGKDLA